MCCHILLSRAEEEAMRECDTHHTHTLSRPTALLTWAASLGWTSAVTCCNIYLQGVPRTCCFYIIIIRTSILLVPSPLHSVLTFNNNIMHILPLPPCGLYNSIRAQNGYGQHRLVKSSCWLWCTQGSHRPISFMRNKYRTRANGLPWNLWNWVSTTISYVDRCSSQPYYNCLLYTSPSPRD